VLSPTGTNSPLSQHWWANSQYGPVAYVNLPYITDNNSADWTVVSGGAGLFTSYASHEYAETITDPFNDGGWYDPAKGGTGEIGDACESDGQSFGLQLSTGLFWVQSQWSNAAGGCVGQAPGSGILDGWFANSTSDWATTGAAFASNSTLLLGAPAPSSTDSEAQQGFTVPAGYHWLSFYFKQNCYNPDGGVDATLNDETDLSKSLGSVVNGYTCISNGGWMLVTAPVTPGHFYTLLLNNWNNSSGMNYTQFKAVALSATQPAPSAPGGIQLWNECNRGWQIYWNPVYAATSYNIYANGTLIATGVTPGYYGYAYTFTSPLNEWYTVTAVTGTGTESQPSTTAVNPIFDDGAC
jgi:hypothetical protein